jgi:hypothetical protein
MNDYGVQYPLWNVRGPIEDVDRLRSLGIGEGLQAELEAWQRSWEERSLGMRDELRHQAEGRRLLKRLQAIAPNGVEFVFPHRNRHIVVRAIIRPIRGRLTRRHRPDDWPSG